MRLSQSHRGQQITDVISNSDHITLNTNRSAKHSHYNKHLHQISPQCLTHYTMDIVGPTQHTLSSDHLPITTTINIRHDYRYNKTGEHAPTTRKLTEHNLWKTQSPLFAQTTIPTNIHTGNRSFTNTILMADKHTIPKGKMHSNCRLLLEDIVCKITQRNNIREQTPVIQLSNS